VSCTGVQIPSSPPVQLYQGAVYYTLSYPSLLSCHTQDVMYWSIFDYIQQFQKEKDSEIN